MKLNIFKWFKKNKPEVQSQQESKKDFYEGLTWFDDSPPTKHPDCKCSKCGKVIEEDFAVRVKPEGEDEEIRLHESCYSQHYIEFHDRQGRDTGNK